MAEKFAKGMFSWLGLDKEPSAWKLRKGQIILILKGLSGALRESIEGRPL